IIGVAGLADVVEHLARFLRSAFIVLQFDQSHEFPPSLTRRRRDVQRDRRLVSIGREGSYQPSSVLACKLADSATSLIIRRCRRSPPSTQSLAAYKRGWTTR